MNEKRDIVVQEGIEGVESGRVKAQEVYRRLDQEFEIDKIEEEEWGLFKLGMYVTESFTKTRKGLVLEFTQN